MVRILAVREYDLHIIVGVSHSIWDEVSRVVLLMLSVPMSHRQVSDPRGVRILRV